MKSLRTVDSYRKLRRQPVWELLAALNGPVIAGVLKTLLSDNERTLASSILHERVSRELESLRVDGEDLPQQAQAYISDWLRSGWLSRKLPAGASEELFELTPAAADAIRFLDSSLTPRKAATESRLATVLTQLARLAEETDANPETRIRMRLLCPRLRAKFGGLGDIEAPLAEIASLDISPNRAVIVENLETGIALPDIPGCVALMKLGLAVGVVGKLPWVEGIPVVYWGDLDTHGFVILDRAREALPQLTSILMDIETVENYLSLAVMEPQQHRRVELAHLERFERTVYDGLYADVWGPKLRIEQERLPWSMAMKRLHEQLY
jgi:hypothetical protein